MLYCLLVSMLIAFGSGDNCHKVTQRAAICNTIFSIIAPDTPEDIRVLKVHYSGPPAALNHDDLQNYTMIENLTISGNVSSIAPLAFKAQTKLKSLEITETLISELPGNLFDENVTSLRELNLQRNYLQDIPLGLFKYLDQVEVLNLAENCIKLNRSDTIGGEFRFLSKLSSLNIANLRRPFSRNIHDPFFWSVNKNLSSLNMSKTNILNDFGKAQLMHFTALETLDISAVTAYAKCPNDSSTFLRLLPKTLKTIYLRHWSSIYKMKPGCTFDSKTMSGLRNLPELEILDMRYSDFIFGHAVRTSTFANFLALKQLDIGWCRISEIENFAFQSCPLLERVVLDGNPLGSRMGAV